MKLFCPTCGYANEAGLGTSLTCKSCGATFTAPSAPPPVAPAPVSVTKPLPVAAPGAPLPLHPAAVASLVLGILCCVPFASLGAIISGLIALQALRRMPDHFRGKGLAVTGVVLGATSVMMVLVAFIAQALQRR